MNEWMNGNATIMLEKLIWVKKKIKTNFKTGLIHVKQEKEICQYGFKWNYTAQLNLFSDLFKLLNIITEEKCLEDRPFKKEYILKMLKNLYKISALYISHKFFFNLKWKLFHYLLLLWHYK